MVIRMNRESSFGMPSKRYGRETICGKCANRRRSDARYGDGWICTCDTSDYFLEETPYNHGCIHFEPKAERRF